MTRKNWGRMVPWRKVAGAAVAAFALSSCAGAVESDDTVTFEPDPEDGTWMVCRQDVCEDLGVEGPYAPGLEDPTVSAWTFDELLAWYDDQGLDMGVLREALRAFHPELAGLVPPPVEEPCEGPTSHDDMMSAYEAANMSAAAGNGEGRMRDVECYAP